MTNQTKYGAGKRLWRIHQESARANKYEPKVFETVKKPAMMIGESGTSDLSPTIY
jgi:hypothetical protein